MQLNVFATELEIFWENQNQKLLAHPEFKSDSGNLFDDTLVFSIGTNCKICRLDFSIFDLPHIKLNQAASLNLRGDIYPLSSKEYAKLIVMNEISLKSASKALGIYQAVMHVSAFLVAQQSLLLTTDNIEDFYISFLTQSVNEKGFSTLLAAPSYKSGCHCIYLVQYRNALQSIGITGFFDDKLTRGTLKKLLDNICRSILNISLNEYKQGSSFNFLGLEMGQYYIDYMRQVYEQDYFYTLVCRKALETVNSQFSLRGTRSGNIKTWKKVCLDTIQGVYVFNTHGLKSRAFTRNLLHDSLAEELFKQYNSNLEKRLSLNEKCIHQLVLKLGLEMRFDSVEVIRILMLQKYYPISSHKTADKVWQNYLNSLDKTFIDSGSLTHTTSNDVYEKMTDIVLDKKLDKQAFMLSLKDWAI
ncbi:MAG: hypothetical protein HRT73_07945, partial [Flavobacteriales bacterium]|nr:hypothetical protein [Flavobacteriales bacterium]